jgi:predicted CopG family antitoxin
LPGLTAGCRTTAVTAPDKPHAAGRKQAWKTLLEFQGGKLAKLEGAESGKFYEVLKELGVDPDKNMIWHPQLFISLENSEGQGRYVLIRTIPLSIPGASAAKMFVFSKYGEILNEQHFFTGWRIDIKSVSKFVDESTGTEMILIETDPLQGGGEEIYRQFYALAGNSVVLVRLEGSKGELERNSYDSGIGPYPPWDSESEVLDRLMKGKRAEKLAVLAWLACEREDEPCEDSDDAVKKDATLARELLANEKLIRHVTYLSEAKDEWLS